MIIDKAKNQADKEKLLAQRNLADMAFARGLKDFYTGSRRSIRPSVLQWLDATARITALNKGNTKVFEKLTKKLTDQGLILEDNLFEGGEIQTAFYEKTVADNPYNPGTLYAKEWERGFNFGFSKNLRQRGKK